MTEWQPIETAPFGSVLLWIPFSKGGGWQCIGCKDEDGEWIDDDGDAIGSPTYWAPLPKPPVPL